MLSFKVTQKLVSKFLSQPSTIYRAAKAFSTSQILEADACRNPPKNSPRSKMSGHAIYMDAQATTPLDFRVLDAMLPYLTTNYGNPHSKSHEFGWATEKAVEKARANVASLIGAHTGDITFTSGATESNNTALKGLAHFYKDTKKHIVTVVTEHKCVLDTCRHLELEGFEVTYLPVKPDGLLDLNTFKAALRPDTLVASVMTVNNEIGVIQDIKEIGKICREKGVFFHTDAAQAVGKIPINVDDMHIDLLSISGHKIYGPKGVGALYLRKKGPRVRIVPLINGGGQEKGLRSGTLPPALVVGLGTACAIAQKEMDSDLQHVTQLANRLKDGIIKRIPNVTFNGNQEKRYPGNLNVSFAYVEGESLIMALKKISISSGSACTTATLEPSYVLRALGVDEDIAHSSLRFGIGRFTTEGEIDYMLDQLATQVQRLRELSPLWELVQEGVDLNTIEWSQPH